MDSSSKCNFKTFIIIIIGPFMKASIAFYDFKYVRLFLLVNHIVSLSYDVRARGQKIKL